MITLKKILKEVIKMKKTVIITSIVVGAVATVAVISIAISSAFNFLETQREKNIESFNNAKQEMYERAIKNIDESRENPFFSN